VQGKTLKMPHEDTMVMKTKEKQMGLPEWKSGLL
jgi:hypothetical protein